MTTPGFTAEASLHRSATTYGARAESASPPVAVVPALLRPLCSACPLLCHWCEIGRGYCTQCSYCEAGMCTGNPSWEPL
jgi:hypothetical protein